MVLMKSQKWFSRLLKNFFSRNDVNFLYSSIEKIIMQNETSIMILEINVATAAPATPICGAPNFPYIRIQLRMIFRMLALSVMYIAYLVIPIPSEKFLIVKNIMNGSIERSMIR